MFKVGMFVSFGIGGADKNSYWLTKGLVELGVDVTVFYNEWCFPKQSEQWEDGVPILSRFSVYDSYKPVEIKRVSEFNNYGLSILNTHRSGDDFWLLPEFETTRFNFKIVETNFHGDGLTKADARIVPSQELYDKIGTHPIIIPNAIQPILTTEDLRKQLGLEGKFVFGKLARPSADIFSSIPMKAYARIQNDNTAFVYVGKHKLADDLSKELGLKNFIFVPQTVDDVEISKYYNTFDVLCHGNILGETFGNTIAEAMMHGKPVVSHRGAKYWLQAQYETMGDMKSLIVADGDVLRYSENMKMLMEDTKAYDHFARYGMQKAQEYNYQNVAKRYLQLYRTMV